MKKAFAIGMIVIGVYGAYAQRPGDSEHSPLPEGALLTKAPETASWKITTTGQAPKSPSDIKWTVVIKNGMSFHSAIELENGLELEEWWVNGVQVLCKKGDSALMVSRQVGEPFYMNYDETDFPDVGWLAADSYHGMQRVNGRQCLVFKKEDRVAWIDLATRLPMQFMENGVTRTYTFLPRPDSAIVIPPNVWKEIVAVQVLKARADRHAPRP
ncbi:MAG: hypothetical protein ACFUZC_08805 [Chthoniobacteraceae bacterium]